MMTIVTTLVAPSLFSLSLKGDKTGTRENINLDEKASISYDYPTEEITNVFANEFIKNFNNSGFFVQKVELDSVVFRISKNDIFLSMFVNPLSILFKMDNMDRLP